MKILNLNLKRSQSHVEMILSFIIFLGFLLVMFIFIAPISQKTVSYATLDAVETAVLDKISINYQYIALILNTSTKVNSCFSIDNNLGMDSNMLVLDESGKILESDNKKTKLNILPVNPNSRIYKIYFSDNFSSSAKPNPCNTKLAKANYSLGVLTLEKSVLFENLALLNKTYFENYTGLKSELALNKDFEFIVYNLSQTQKIFDTTSLHKVKNFQVLSRDIPLRIINTTGSQSDIVLNLRVW